MITGSFKLEGIDDLYEIDLTKLVHAMNDATGGRVTALGLTDPDQNLARGRMAGPAMLSGLMQMAKRLKG